MDKKSYLKEIIDYLSYFLCVDFFYISNKVGMKGINRV